MLEVSADDLEWTGGAWQVRCDPEQSATMPQIAMAAHGSVELPDGVEGHLDAETVYNPLFHNGSNLGTYYNSDLDGLMDAAQKEMDEKKRLALYHQINKLWIEDAAAAPLYKQLDLYGANKRISWKARSDERIKAVEMTIK